ncbi:Methyltransferase type 11 [Microcystis aeruginosa PCC 9806]|uniref:Class I SAM-dependent methyltransferase n=2 Tax=Microcystis TaxID=1125 RepID=A0A552LPA7_9CHRO|nr:class I SAM-dependent methyltransferase [Microcystis aeruginosa]TRV22052.1 MAG: class I SAM-dependent methyltransferase [Microcystis flos-aquae Mf_WU_F_19750830_S460]CCI15634.1 Methyltransferase type 11 [Microcystis aeruginosa PCC 9806]
MLFKQKFFLIVSFLIVVFCGFGLLNFTYDASVLAQQQYYQIRSLHSRDGIGKFYLGREIAKVMGHQEMLWLERPSRRFTEKPDDLITALQLNPTDLVADIGAGTGYFSFPMANLVEQVFAVDVQPEMLGAIDFLAEENQVKNVTTILGTETDPKLPINALDLALMVDAYHEFSSPREMMENLVKSLKPDGRVVLVEYRRENPLIPIKALHKMTRRQVEKEMAAIGLLPEEIIETLPQQHLMIFQKAGSSG